MSEIGLSNANCGGCGAEISDELFDYIQVSRCRG